jgi:hypothetical protein
MGEGNGIGASAAAYNSESDALIDIEQIVASVPKESVVARTTVDGVLAIIAMYKIVAAKTVEDVIAT